MGVGMISSARRRTVLPQIGKPTPLFLTNRATSNHSGTPITYNSEIYDTEGMLATPTANAVVPSSLNGKLLAFQTNNWGLNTSSWHRVIADLGEGDVSLLGIGAKPMRSSGWPVFENEASAGIPVATGNIFKVQSYYGTSAGTEPVDGATASNHAWFAAEKLHENTRRAIFQKTASQSVGTIQTLTWDPTPVFDNGGFTISGGTDLVVPRTALYEYGIGIKTAHALNDLPAMNFLSEAGLSARPGVGRMRPPTAYGTKANSFVSGIVALTAGQFVRAYLDQTITANVVADPRTFFWIREVSPLITYCTAYLNANMSYLASSGNWPVPFDKNYDDNSGGAIHSETVNNSRFYCPPGHSYGRMAMGISTAASNDHFFLSAKNGAEYPGEASQLMSAEGTAKSAWVPMTPGTDYFQTLFRGPNATLKGGTNYGCWAQAQFI